MRALLYCTKGGQRLCAAEGRYGLFGLDECPSRPLNGTVCAAAEIERVTRWKFLEWEKDDGVDEESGCRIIIRGIDPVRDYGGGNMSSHARMTERLCRLACVGKHSLLDYAGGKDGSSFYAWHLSCVRAIAPKEFAAAVPQSWRYVWLGGERAVLVSVKPKHLMRILNGEKTIEIRKSCPKGLLTYDRFGIDE